MSVALSDFRIRFPEFSEKSDEQIELYLNDGIATNFSNCPNNDLIIYYYTAHQLSTVGKMNSDDAEDINRGVESMIDTGDVKTSYHKTDSNDGDFDSTIYGRNYKRLVEDCKRYSVGNFLIV